MSARETTREFQPADRYLYDFKYCTYAKGWAQIDTKQDASYFGTWTNPTERVIFSYCEGDTTHTQCSTDDDYKQALLELVAWNKENGYWLGIDPGFNPEMKDAFVKLDLGHLLH